MRIREANKKMQRELLGSKLEVYRDRGTASSLLAAIKIAKSSDVNGVFADVNIAEIADMLKCILEYKMDNFIALAKDKIAKEKK